MHVRNRLSPQMIAAVLQHVTCYLQSGSVKAAQRAVLLLERLALDPDVDGCIRENGGALAESIEAALRQPGMTTQGR